MHPPVIDDEDRPLRDARCACGEEIAPPTAITPGDAMSSSSRSALAPMIARTASRSDPPAVRSTTRASFLHVKDTSGCVTARSATTRTAADASVPPT